MPPKPKLSPGEIVDCATLIVREEGFDSLTVRAICKRLNCSISSIFTLFSSIEEVKQETIKAIKKIYEKHIQAGFMENENNYLLLRDVGVRYILFAQNETNYFKLLFMSEQHQKSSISNILPKIDDDYGDIIGWLNSFYKMSIKEANDYYRRTWIYCHGIATLCATKMISPTKEEVELDLCEFGRDLLVLMGKIKV